MCNYINQLEGAGRQDKLNSFKEAIKRTARVLMASGANIRLQNDVHMALWGDLEYVLKGTLNGGPFFRHTAPFEWGRWPSLSGRAL